MEEWSWRRGGGGEEEEVRETEGMRDGWRRGEGVLIQGYNILILNQGILTQPGEHAEAQIGVKMTPENG